MSDWKATRSSPRCGKGFFSQSQLPAHETLLRCPYSPRVQSRASASVPMLKVPNTGSHVIVRTHKNVQVLKADIAEPCPCRCSLKADVIVAIIIVMMIAEICRCCGSLCFLVSGFYWQALTVYNFGDWFLSAYVWKWDTFKKLCMNYHTILEIMKGLSCKQSRAHAQCCWHRECYSFIVYFVELLRHLQFRNLVGRETIKSHKSDVGAVW